MLCAIPIISLHPAPCSCHPMTPHTPSLQSDCTPSLHPVPHLRHPNATYTATPSPHSTLYSIPEIPFHPVPQICTPYPIPNHPTAPSTPRPPPCMSPHVPSTHPTHSGSAPGTRSRRPAAAAHGDRRRRAGSGGWPCRQCPPAGPRRCGDTACHRQRPPDRHHTLQGAAVCRGGWEGCGWEGVDTDIAVRGL